MGFVSPEIIHQAIWLYLRFTLSLRDQRPVGGTRRYGFAESIRRWVKHFGTMFAADAKRSGRTQPRMV
jgi:transposase-like protein